MPANKVRIVGGEWRSRILSFTPRPDLRPTPDRVRETLFNWLGQDLNGKICLDLFAGSGALGFEAASRGATRVMMIERDARTFKALQENITVLGAQTVELQRVDALEFLRAGRSKYDVVFIDPPFRVNLLPQVLVLLPARLTPQALVYVEAPRTQQFAPGWQMWRHGRAGTVHYALLKWTTDHA